MTDIRTETLVPVIPTAKDRVLKILLTAQILVSLVLVMVFGLIGIVILAASIWLLLRQLRKTDAEYEYVHTNDVFDVDVVIGNSRRRQLCTVNLGQVELVAPVDAQELAVYGSIPKTDYSGNAGGCLYAMVILQGGKRRKLILKLDEPMRRSLKQWIPGKVL